VSYSERLAEIGAQPSIGSVGDSYDNGLAESVNGLYKTELIRRQGPWRNLEHVELATLAYVEWFKTDGVSTANSTTSRPPSSKPTTTVTSHEERTLQHPPRPDAKPRPAQLLVKPGSNRGGERRRARERERSLTP
jgi:hypothetical protein